MATTLELERSKHGSKPVEYYHFFRATKDWFYTTSRRTKTLDGIQYRPLQITRGVIELGGEDKPGALTVTLPTASALGLVLQEGTSPTPISLQILRQQPGATDDPWIIFLGEMTSVDIQSEVVTLQCLPFTARLGLLVPQGLYQKDQCQWNTYDPDTCGVNKALYTFTGSVTDMTGLAVTVAGAGSFDPGTGMRDDMFAGGILLKSERQGMIESQDGDVITLIESVPTLAIGNSIQLIAGDDRSLTTCREKFNNARRRLSLPHLPVLNPFYGQGFRR